MDNRINIGIDLGTTNSLIASAKHGEVEVFKNPNGFGQVLPSVVGYRRGRLLLGEQARRFAEKHPRSIISRFKRKMGTSETFLIEGLEETRTPIELSAEVLKELRTFVHDDERVESAVITIPASFDTIQSNATKEAGFQAGLKQVILLQEPIAASLAYANKRKSGSVEGKWLVYDLGGGTFDVALVAVADDELKVVDHEGDNYLGGADFDAAIVEQLIVPQLEERGSFEDLTRDLRSRTGKRNDLWVALLLLAEQAKITLSNRTSAEIEFDVVDDDGDEHEMIITITRSEFEQLIKAQVDQSADMIQRMLSRNSLRPSDLEFVLMVGGSTYIPYVRQRIHESLQVRVDSEIDPATAIVAGAAHVAAGKRREIENGRTEEQPDKRGGDIRIKMAYQPTSREDSELFAAKVEGGRPGLMYRITRADGGYDSGLRPLQERINEDLPLEGDAYNIFELRISDEQGNKVTSDASEIQIAHGKYSVAGQPVPADVSLVLDDLENGRTILKALISRNTILPARQPVTVAANRTVRKGSAEDVIRFIVVEGPSDALPEANKTIGQLTISGAKISRDVPKGSDIDLTVEMTESRDLTVTAYITSIDQAFQDIFTGSERHVDVDALTDSLELLHEQIEAEVEDAESIQNYEGAKELTRLKVEAARLGDEAIRTPVDDGEDARYKIDDRKMKIARELDGLTRAGTLDRLRQEYHEAKEACRSVIDQHGNDYDRHCLQDIIQQEPVFIGSNNPSRIRQSIRGVESLRVSILRRTPNFLLNLFDSLVEQRERFNEQRQAKSLIDAGRVAVQREDYDRLDEIIDSLINLLPGEEQRATDKVFTGIS